MYVSVGLTLGFPSPPASRSEGAQSVTAKSTDCGFNPRGNEIFTNFYIFISSFWCRDRARRWVPPLNTQCLHNSAENGKRCVLTLGSFYVPCCVRNKAWSWFYLSGLITYKIHENKIFSEIIFKLPIHFCTTIKRQLLLKTIENINKPSNKYFQIDTLTTMTLTI